MTALSKFITARLSEYGDGDLAAADPAPRAVMRIARIWASRPDFDRAWLQV